jgi:beta-lactamase class A
MVNILFKSTYLLIIISLTMGPPAFSATTATAFQKKLSELEKSSGGRIGLFAFNPNDHQQFQFRGDETFPFCSTFKAILVAAILKKSMKEKKFLKQRIKYQQKDLDQSGYAPIAKDHLETGMTIAELSKATIQYSDNAAANLLMKNLGGPAAVTDFTRSIGDAIFRLDRWEPELNSAIPGEQNDTTTPSAIAKSLQKIALGDVLSLPLRELFQTWMMGNITGNARIRAGVPKTWKVGDKTGTCSYGTTNDIAILWPPQGPPFAVAIFFTQKQKDALPKDEVIAAVTRLLISEIK